MELNKPKTKKSTRIIYSLVILVFVVGLLAYYYSLPRNYNQVYGVTFDSEYAKYLCLNPQVVYNKILTDWGFRYTRLSVNWNAVEKQKGEFDFTELDWLMDKSVEHNAKVILVIGQKTLRWPECHLPDWAMEENNESYRLQLKKYMATVVDRYKNNSALEIWQVENEPFLAFGKCPAYNADYLKEEVEMVKSLDKNHKILITDSGELSTWQKTARVGNFFGTTLYRVVWHQHLGYFNYDWIPASFYKFKLLLTGRNIEDSFVVELQAEPWIPDKSINDYDLTDQLKSMSPKRFRDNVDYAQRVGFSRAYLWGAEWWFWLAKEKGIFFYDNMVKSLNKN